MPRWTEAELRAYETRRAGLRSPQPELTPGPALGDSPPGEIAGSQVPRRRASVRYDVWSVRPLDWDNYFLKPLQDCIVHAGLLVSDDWESLEGHVRSHKAHSKAEERTEVTIEEIASL